MFNQFYTFYTFNYTFNYVSTIRYNFRVRKPNDNCILESIQNTWDKIEGGREWDLICLSIQFNNTLNLELPFKWIHEYGYAYGNNYVVNILEIQVYLCVCVREREKEGI